MILFCIVFVTHGPEWLRVKENLFSLTINQPRGFLTGSHYPASLLMLLSRWRRNEGRAFEVVMCELKRRLLGKVIKLDTGACTLDCGDGLLVHLNSNTTNGV